MNDRSITKEWIEELKMNCFIYKSNNPDWDFIRCPKCGGFAQYKISFYCTDKSCGLSVFKTRCDDSTPDNQDQQ